VAITSIMSEARLHVGIIGAGLGGVAAAIPIARAGHKVTILEQAPSMGEVSQPAISKPLN
jgi:salicylate hydroxylase